MQITVKTIEGAVYVVEATSNNQTVLDLKKAIQEKSGVGYKEQRLIFKGKLLADENPLSSYGIEDGFTIHMVNKAPPPPPPQQQQQQPSPPPPQQVPLPNMFQPGMGGQFDIRIDLSNLQQQQQQQQQGSQRAPPPFNPFMGAPFNPFMPPPPQMQGQQQQQGQNFQQQQQQGLPPGMGALFGQLQQAFGALSQMMQQPPQQPQQPSQQSPPQQQQSQDETSAANSESEPTVSSVDVIIQEENTDSENDENSDDVINDVINESQGPTVTVQDIPVTETFHAISEQINNELHSNQPRSVYEVMRDVSQRTGDDDDDDYAESSAPNSGSEEHKLKQLINTIYSSLNMVDLMEFFSMDFKNAYKIHESGRKWLCDNLADPKGSDNITEEQLMSFVDCYYKDFSKFSKEEIPSEIMARVKEGVDFKKVISEELKKHILRILKLLMMPLSQDHSVFAEEFKLWIFRFVKEFVDTITDVMVGGIDDVQVVAQYFFYNVNK